MDNEQSAERTTAVRESPTSESCFSARVRRPSRPGLLAALCLTVLSPAVARDLAAGPPQDANSADASAAWKALVAEDRPAYRVRLVSAALKAIGRQPDDVRRFISGDTAYDAHQEREFQHTLAISDGAKTVQVSFNVRLPEGYRPERSWPAVLACHGTGGNGPQFTRIVLGLLGKDADKYIIIAPTMPGGEYYSSTKRGFREQVHLQTLDWAARHLNVDDDRVYVFGNSMGGHCTWNLATMFPGRFAAGVSTAGVPTYEGTPFTVNLYLENLSNLPFWSIWGELDVPAPPLLGQVQMNRAAKARLAELNNTKYRGTELAGVGHDGCFPQPREFAAFLAAAKRDLMPTSFVHVFHLQRHARGYCMEAISLAARPVRMDVLPFALPGKDEQEEFRAKVEEYFRQHMFRFSAELDRQANMLAVTFDRVAAVRIYVLDGMFDLSRPVTLKAGGRTWTGRLTASAACMLTHYAADRDASAVVVNEVDLYSTGRAVVRY